MPHGKCGKGKVEGYKLEIRGILATLNAQSSNVDESAPHFTTIYPHTATTSVRESGTPSTLLRGPCTEY
jgi:hypothetical protein